AETSAVLRWIWRAPAARQFQLSPHRAIVQLQKRIAPRSICTELERDVARRQGSRSWVGPPIRRTTLIGFKAASVIYHLFTLRFALRGMCERVTHHRSRGDR